MLRKQPACLALGPLHGPSPGHAGAFVPFLLMKGFYFKSPEALHSRDPSLQSDKAEKQEENSALCPWSGSVELSTHLSDLTVCPDSTRCSPAGLLTPWFPSDKSTFVVLSLVRRQWEGHHFKPHYFPLCMRGSLLRCPERLLGLKTAFLPSRALGFLLNCYGECAKSPAMFIWLLRWCTERE